MDVRISLNHNTLEYEADYVEHGKLRTICTCPRYHGALRAAKHYVEDTGESGQVMSHDGMIYTFSGKSWRTTRPSN